MTNSEFHERLRQALDHASMGYRSLAARLRDAGVPSGYSERSVAFYLSGQKKRPPSVAWVAAAADILGVSEPWLARGAGRMVGVTASADEDRVDASGRLTQAEILSGSLPDYLYRTIAKNAEWVGGAFLGAWAALVESQPDKHPKNLTRNEYLALGRIVARPALEISNMVGGNAREWDARDFAMYLNAVWTAVLLATPKPRQGRSLKELVQSAPAPWKKSEGGR